MFLDKRFKGLEIGHRRGMAFRGHLPQRRLEYPRRCSSPPCHSGRAGRAGRPLQPLPHSRRSIGQDSRTASSLASTPSNPAVATTARYRQPNITVVAEHVHFTGRVCAPPRVRRSAQTASSSPPVHIPSSPTSTGSTPPASTAKTYPVFTSNTVMRRPTQPERLVIIGSGIIAMEFAHIFSSSDPGHRPRPRASPAGHRRRGGRRVHSHLRLVPFRPPRRAGRAHRRRPRRSHDRPRTSGRLGEVRPAGDDHRRRSARRHRPGARHRRTRCPPPPDSTSATGTGWPSTIISGCSPRARRCPRSSPRRHLLTASAQARGQSRSEDRRTQPRRRCRRRAWAAREEDREGEPPCGARSGDPPPRRSPICKFSPEEAEEA